ncbi:3-methyl-2-oxobutanoate hydroxymethyltransferase [Brevibacterium atlanticum]|uniref:3-methyl-2-oxobutanoate hydroxymethyltransferase n=1 Tax=Brevibacterium atlanticum TaxID=2697563 RepID=UPI00141F7B87|nr:3-methyl-2-oxobutanoate hydroxymethyltransferase [Brevibacterium atlanticum]
MPEAAHSNQTASTTSAEEPSPYGGGAAKPAAGGTAASSGSAAAAGGGAPAAPPRRIRTLDLVKAKAEGRRWAMLTSYDQYTAALFEQAGVEALLIGDSAANNVYGHDTTLPVTVDELIPLARAVASATSRALIVADLPFGSYEISDEQAVATAVRFMKEAGVHAIKLEGGVRMASRIKAITNAGIPVMAHIGFTPQAEHNLGGYKVQGRGGAGDALLEDARAVAEAGAFSVVMEMVPSGLAGQVTAELDIPTVGIGAGADCDAQVLVWQDMAGLRTGRAPRFVKRYADLHSVLTEAVGTYVDEVKSGVFPEPERSFD